MTKAFIDYWSGRIEHLLKACANDRNLLPEQHTIDVAISTHGAMLKNSVNFWLSFWLKNQIEQLNTRKKYWREWKCYAKRNGS